MVREVVRAARRVPDRPRVWEGLLHGLGHGRLTDPPVRHKWRDRWDHDRRGCPSPPVAPLVADRQRGWNSLPCDAWIAKRSGGATPPRCKAPKLDLGSLHDGQSMAN